MMRLGSAQESVRPGAVADDVMSRGRRRRRGRGRQKGERQPSWRAMGALLAVTAIVVVGLSLRVANVQVVGMLVADDDRLREILEPYVGERVLFVDYGTLGKVVRDDPWVSDARVSFQLPRTLLVRLDESVPRLRLPDGRGIDERGLVLPPRAGVSLQELPLLVGAAFEGDRLVSWQRTSVREFVGSIAQVPWNWNEGLVSVRLDDDGLTLQTGGGTEVVLGRGDYPARLRRYLSIHSKLTEPFPRRVDLRFARQVVVAERSPIENVGG